MSRPLRSTPVTGASSLLRDGPPADAATVLSPPGFCRSDAPSCPARNWPGSVRTRLPTFPAKAAAEVHAASMPDTAWPVHGLPPGLSRVHSTNPVLMSLRYSRHVNSGRLPRPHLTRSCRAFSTSLTTTVFSQRSMWRFEAVPHRTIPEGQQSSIFRRALLQADDCLPITSLHIRGTLKDVVQVHVSEQRGNRRSL